MKTKYLLTGILFVLAVAVGVLALVGHSQWESVTSSPANIDSGGAIHYPGRGDTVYVLAGGGAQTFWSYSLTGDTWATLADISFAANLGAALCRPGSSDTIYAFVGGNQQKFYGYAVSANSWAALANPPAAVSGGGALAYPGSGDTIYAFRGANSKNFWSYSLARDTWVALASTNDNVSNGGALCHPGSGDTVYAVVTNGLTTRKLFGYSISRDTWSELASLPAIPGAGAALAYPGHGDTLYALRGYDGVTTLAATTTFWAYSISRNVWDTPAAVPGAVYGGGALAGANGLIYALRGNTTKDVYRFRPPSGADTALTVSEVLYEDSDAVVNAPVATSDSFVQIIFSQGGVTAGTLAAAANATGSGSNYRETTTLSNANDTIQIALWTNQNPLTLFVGLRSDTATLRAAGLPTGISDNDTGRRAFGATAVMLEFADSTGRFLGTVSTTTSVGDSVAYTLRYDLSESTVKLYKALGFDTAAGSSSFRFWYADTYGANWSVDNTCTVAVSTGATSGSLLVTVTGLTRDLPGGLGGVPSSTAAAPGSSSCVLTALEAPGCVLSWARALRDWVLVSAFGRLVTALYYAL